MGTFVVVGALLLMAAVTFNLLGGDRPGTGVLPSPTGTASTSPRPASPSPALTPTPGPLPTPETPPAPTPDPSPFVVEVREGPGYITFGSGWDSNQNMQNVSATFTPGGRLAWSALLTEPAAAARLDITVHRVDPTDGSESLVYEEQYRVRNPDGSWYLRRVSMGDVTDGPGIYVMRYLRDGDVLSEGYFEVVANDD